MLEFLNYLKYSAYGSMVGESFWGYPIFEIIHLLGVTLLVGAITLTDLRLLGVSRRLPVSLTADYLLRWVWIGFALVVFSGLSLFSSDGANLIKNPFFLSKMVLIFLAGCNAVFFHFRIYKGVMAWQQDIPTPLGAKACAIASMVFWFAAIMAGRLIAYPSLWGGA